MSKAKKENENGKEEDILKPDNETLHTTDPQEHMKGPISSVVQTVKEASEDDISKEEADKKKEEGI